ncbi:MAG TPA: recombination protein NinB [Massilibacterium sp.]|nr:recombination protein NinB [Massilibacterium sp.]
MKIPVSIVDGKIKQGRFDVRDAIAKKKDGRYLIEILPWKRTLEQNSLMWKWFTIIGNDMGYTKEEVHDHMIIKFAPIYTRRNIETGKPEQQKMTTSMMNVEQMSEFLDCVDRFAAEWDIILPKPEKENK